RQPRRIVRLALEKKTRAAFGDGCHLCLGVLGGAGAHAPSAAPGKLGQCGERVTGAAAMGEQFGEGGRADVVAADQAKPVEALASAEGHFWPIRVSDPAMRRRMFWWWRAHRSTVSARNTQVTALAPAVKHRKSTVAALARSALAEEKRVV